MRYLAIMLAAAALLFSQAFLAPNQALAGQKDGIQKRIILVDSRSHRGDNNGRDEWNRRDNRRDHRDNRWNRQDNRRDRRDRRDERESYAYWQHHRQNHGYRPYYSGRNSMGFFWWQVPGPLPLFIPVPR